MRAWIPCSAMLLAVLLPAAASAQPMARNGGFYGNTYIAPGYDYPYARAEDGYAESYPLATRPSSRAYRTERMAGYPIRIEMLSRFRTEAEAKAIGEGLGEAKASQGLVDTFKERLAPPSSPNSADKQTAIQKGYDSKK